MNIHEYHRVKVAVIGAGRAGLAAAHEIRRFTHSVVLIDDTELTDQAGRLSHNRAGSFAEAANRYHHTRELNRRRFGSGTPAEHSCSNAARPRGPSDRGLREPAASFDGVFIEGRARLLGPNHIFVAGRLVEAEAVVIAAGRRGSLPEEWLRYAGESLNGDDLFDGKALPRSVAVIGLGPSGLVTAQMLCRFGVRVAAFDNAFRLAGVDDPDIEAEALRRFGREFPISLGKAIRIERYGCRFCIRTASGPVIVDRLLFSGDQGPGFSHCDWHKLGLACDVRGLPRFDRRTLQIPGMRVFFAGVGQGGRDLAAAAAEGRVAGYNAVHASPLSLPDEAAVSTVYSDPHIVSVGSRWTDLDPERSVSAEIRYMAHGAGFRQWKDRGLLKLYADRESAVVKGGAIIGPGCEHFAGLLSGFIQERLTIADALQHQGETDGVEVPLWRALRELERRLETPLHETHDEGERDNVVPLDRGAIARVAEGGTERSTRLW